jgi:hypothetical protein
MKQAALLTSNGPGILTLLARDEDLGGWFADVLESAVRFFACAQSPEPGVRLGVVLSCSLSTLQDCLCFYV